MFAGRRSTSTGGGGLKPASIECHVGLALEKLWFLPQSHQGWAHGRVVLLTELIEVRLPPCEASAVAVQATPAVCGEVGLAGHTAKGSKRRYVFFSRKSVSGCIHSLGGWLCCFGTE